MDSKRKYSRRQMLALTGAGILTPFLGKAESKPERSGTDEYDIVLKEDGTTVRIPKQVVKSSRVVNKKVSNKALLKWLKKK